MALASQAEDISGNTYGRLTAIRFANKRSKWGHPYWLCKCKCGRRVRVLRSNLVAGSTTSCGCVQKELLLDRITKHGHRNHTIYACWRAMKARCSNPRLKAYKNYGARGIIVCKRWRKFENFMADMLPLWKRGLWLERVNNNGNYTPSNCCWATPSHQRRNQRRMKK
jgi:hypothetical protein